MAVMRKCCFCWDLKVGGIVLGVFSVLFSLASIVYCIWMIVEMELQNWRGRPVVQNYYQKRLEDEIILYRLISEILLGIGIFVNIAIFISSICLIVGARTEKKSRILPYLIFQWLGIIGTALYCFFHGSTAVKEGRSQQGTITIVVGSVYIVLAFYFWFCVLALYQTIRDNQRHNPRVQHPQDRHAAYSPVQ
ncbi:uncharacterized protein LOC129800698 isoform X2 [Phlebotomus papatasi]|uniref:MARVEL domain-containing protein n=1 Tax=Phlebotomus papatasi TaxID=29031 RepID=A0A1B0CYU5_PHLPP|nr:uncharacterized protein LOC129800698 isoform X2 [Phlebotomus papatasi]XP_055701267.1 uncharacterized protein LOC129800698 isoform X2 [Phlebotomus papatasi]